MTVEIDRLGLATHIARTSILAVSYSALAAAAASAAGVWRACAASMRCEGGGVAGCGPGAHMAWMRLRYGGVGACGRAPPTSGRE